MADLTIDNAVADAEIGGGEKIPVSDGGNPRSVTTDKLKDFVLQRIAALTAAQSVDANTDGVYLLKGGELKPVSAAVLAAAVLDYAFALTSVAKITGNEKVSVKDANSKKTISLDALKSWLQSDTVTKEELKTVQAAVANKVDAEDGKGLSSNDFTDADRDKIRNLTDSIQSNWAQTDSSKMDFIKNKPEIPKTITVDQILDENSSNPVANSVVAALALRIGNSSSEQFRVISALPTDGNDFGLNPGAIVLVSDLSNPINNNRMFLLSKESQWVELAGETLLALTFSSLNLSNMARMYIFAEGELPEEGSAAGIPKGAFILDNETWDDGTTHHLLINKGDENDFRWELIANW